MRFWTPTPQNVMVPAVNDRSLPAPLPPKEPKNPQKR